MSHSESRTACARVRATRGVLCLSVGLLLGSELGAQVSPEEHAKHHPGAAGAGAMPAAPGGDPSNVATPAAGKGPAPGGMGGMMEGMGEMMKGMGAPPPLELYPSLMALPELSPDQRKLVEEQAAERMHAGTVLMGRALDSLNTGAQSGDYAGMHEAAVRLGEGLAQLESGIAARRALAEGRAPRAVALAWFRREMNLSPGAAPVALQPLGVTPFHFFTMLLLVAFALAMLALYFFKMRRAAALFGRLESDSGSPPPGAAPPLAGVNGPPAPGGPPAAVAKPAPPALGAAPPWTA